MRRTSLFSLAFLSAAIAGASAGAPNVSAPPSIAPSAAELKTQSGRFASVEITADLKALPENERQALRSMVAAARVMDALFLRQVWSGNDALLQELARTGDPLGQARLRYFLINKGPWSKLDQNRAFLPGVPDKPEGGNFYPAGATKAEVQRWLDTLPSEARKQATGFFTTIRRRPDGALTAVPYSVEYQAELSQAAGSLREAAALTTQPTLKKFLASRADAFLSNDYYASDVAWMELDASIEPTIGPYETYADEWFSYKAAFEAFIALRDDAETTKLRSLSAQLQELENTLPIDPKYRNPQLGALAPIRVVNVVFTAGEANCGVQTAAFNLPNDERVVKEKGSKRVMLKNVQEAKFKVVLLPIAKVALPAAAQRDVSFDAFFTHILMHELMHGLGPHSITVSGPQGPVKTTVRQELKEAYSAIEEAKADVSGLWALKQLADRKLVPAAVQKTMYTTFLASAFRSIRFGVNEAHGRGIAVQMNRFLDAGAFQVRPDGTFVVNEAKMDEAVTSLTRDLMTIQAEGNYAKAKELLERMGVVRPEVQKVLDRLKAVPVDIQPRYPIAG